MTEGTKFALLSERVLNSKLIAQRTYDTVSGNHITSKTKTVNRGQRKCFVSAYTITIMEITKANIVI